MSYDPVEAAEAYYGFGSKEEYEARSQFIHSMNAKEAEAFFQGEAMERAAQDARNRSRGRQR